MLNADDILGCWYKTQNEKTPAEQFLKRKLEIFNFQLNRRVSHYLIENEEIESIVGEYQFDGRFLILVFNDVTKTFRVEKLASGVWNILGKTKAFMFSRSYFGSEKLQEKKYCSYDLKLDRVSIDQPIKNTPIFEVLLENDLGKEEYVGSTSLIVSVRNNPIFIVSPSSNREMDNFWKNIISYYIFSEKILRNTMSFEEYSLKISRQKEFQLLFVD